MPSRIVLQSLFLVRDGKRVSPEIGKAFNFSADELKEIEASAPSAIRSPINEGGSDTEVRQDNTTSTVNTGNAAVDSKANNVNDETDSTAPGAKKAGSKNKPSKIDDEI